MAGYDYESVLPGIDTLIEEAQARPLGLRALVALEGVAWEQLAEDVN